MVTDVRMADALIQREVLREFAWDSRLRPTDIGVAVRDGLVTLTGAVDSYTKKIAAQEAAHRVRGVLDVANDLDVQTLHGFLFSDAELARSVRATLEWNMSVPDRQIKTTVSNGWVTLEGEVDTGAERDAAELCIRDLVGLRGVTNRIEMAPPPADSEDVRITIADALERRADREASRISVEVEEGNVVLKGAVRSWAEKRAVLGAVSHAKGVRSVEDHMKINPFA